MKGVYCLIIRLDKARNIQIGRLSKIGFKKGYYCYIGSALNNLDKRVERHRSKEKRLKWHIDYFLKYGKIIGVIKIKTNKKIECMLSKRINKMADDLVNGFGCSDCKCKSHLYYFSNNPLWKDKGVV